MKGVLSRDKRVKDLLVSSVIDYCSFPLELCRIFIKIINKNVLCLHSPFGLAASLNC